MAGNPGRLPQRLRHVSTCRVRPGLFAMDALQLIVAAAAGRQDAEG